MRLRSYTALREFMDFNGLQTGYALAKRAGILPGTANFLVSGRRSTCSRRTAEAIEDALGAPRGFLFEPDSRSRPRPRTEAGAGRGG